MRWAIALVLVGTNGCAVDFPDPLNAEIDAPAGADDAQAFAVAAWSDRLGAGLDDPPPVRWFGAAPDGSRCLMYDHPAVPDVAGCMAGATPMVSGGGPYEVHLIAYGDRASSSAIAHEHLHWALDQATGDNDYYHRSMDWAAVGELEDSLVAAGL